MVAFDTVTFWRRSVSSFLSIPYSNKISNFNPISDYVGDIYNLLEYLEFLKSL